MTNNEKIIINNDKIQILQSALDSKSSDISVYIKLLDDLGDTVYNYAEYVEQNVDKELKRLPEVDYHMCCCLLTLILRENYWNNGSFEERYASGVVTFIVERMKLLLKIENTRLEIQ